MVREVGRELKAYKNKKGTVLQLKKKRAEAKMYNEVNKRTCWILTQYTVYSPFSFRLLATGDLVNPPRLLPFEALCSLPFSPVLCLRTTRVASQKGRNQTLPRFDLGTV